MQRTRKPRARFRPRAIMTDHPITPEDRGTAIRLRPRTDRYCLTVRLEHGAADQAFYIALYDRNEHPLVTLWPYPADNDREPVLVYADWVDECRDQAPAHVTNWWVYYRPMWDCPVVRASYQVVDGTFDVEAYIDLLLEADEVPQEFKNALVRCLGWGD